MFLGSEDDRGMPAPCVLDALASSAMCAMSLHHLSKPCTMQHGSTQLSVAYTQNGTSSMNGSNGALFMPHTNEPRSQLSRRATESSAIGIDWN